MRTEIDLKEFHTRRARVKREALGRLQPGLIFSAARDLAYSEGFLEELANPETAEERVTAFLADMAGARNMVGPTEWSALSGRALALEERLAENNLLESKGVPKG